MSTDNTETEPAGVRRLREAREALAILQAEQATSAELPVRPGDSIHALRTGVTFGTSGGFLSASHVSRRGETYVITENIISASKDAGGNSWLRHLVSEEAQLAAWQEVRFGLGPAPVDLVPEHGTSEWRMAREEARQAAWREPDHERRAAALAAVNAKFGDAPLTSTTLSTAPDPSIKLADEQRKALDAGGVRHTNNYAPVRR